MFDIDGAMIDMGHALPSALKAAMEGRMQPAQGPAQHAAAWLALLRQGGLTTAQRQRLQDLVAALRQAPPGTLARVGASARSSGV